MTIDVLDHAEAMKEFDTMWHDNGREEVEE